LRPLPQTGEIKSLGTMTLPIRDDARRLTLAHMERREAWAIFEISGQQPDETFVVLSLLTVPDAWIEKRLRTSTPASFKAPAKSDCRLLD